MTKKLWEKIGGTAFNFKFRNENLTLDQRR